MSGLVQVNNITEFHTSLWPNHGMRNLKHKSQITRFQAGLPVWKGAPVPGPSKCTVLDLVLESIRWKTCRIALHAPFCPSHNLTLEGRVLISNRRLIDKSHSFEPELRTLRTFLFVKVKWKKLILYNKCSSKIKNKVTVNFETGLKRLLFCPSSPWAVKHSTKVS